MKIGPGLRAELRAGRSSGLGAGLEEAEQVARRVAEGAVTDAVVLLHGLLQHFGPRRADRLKGGVAVVGGEVDPAGQGAAAWPRPRGRRRTRPGCRSA